MQIPRGPFSRSSPAPAKIPLGVLSTVNALATVPNAIRRLLQHIRMPARRFPCGSGLGTSTGFVERSKQLTDQLEQARQGKSLLSTSAWFRSRPQRSTGMFPSRNGNGPALKCRAG